MILIKNYNKPKNCYECPGFSQQQYYCRFNPSIDFDKCAYDPVPRDCPIVDISSQEGLISEWIRLDDAVPETYECANCHTLVLYKTALCPRCGRVMANDIEMVNYNATN